MIWWVVVADLRQRESNLAGTDGIRNRMNMRFLCRIDKRIDKLAKSQYAVKHESHL